jgi:hypothetical protein
MARDRNVYVWQAYVIVMSIVSVVCIGAMIFTIFLSGTNFKTVEAAIEKEKNATKQLGDASNKRQILDHIIGVNTLPDAEFEQLLQSSGTGDEKLTAAVNAYNANKSLFGQATGAKSYSKLIETLTRELRTRNGEVEGARKKEAEMQASYNATIASETKAREAAERKSQEAAKELENERAKFIQTNGDQQKLISDIELEKQGLVKSFNKKISDLTESLNKANQENNEIKNRLQKMVNRLDEIQGQDFQYAQGKVDNVAQGGELIYINLGRADLLRPGVIFGVIDGDTTRISEAKPKARIEVVAIVDEHQARCRLLADRTKAIILVGDAIYSPAWQPGKEVEFALVGSMDIDGDGKDDRTIVKDLIRKAGGKVTADLLPTGKLEGRLSEQTRFLVKGEDFKVRGGALDTATGKLDEATSEAGKKRSELEAQARAYSISTISLDKLLGWIRDANSNDVIPLGNGLRSKPSDYLPHSGNVPSTGKVSELFQTRDGKIRPSAP